MSTLAEQIREELSHPNRDRRLMVVVGSGVSIGATRGHPLAKSAGWKGLLELGLERCVELNLRSKAWANAQKRQLSKGDLDTYLTVATEIENRLEAPENGAFAALLDQTVGQLRITGDRTVLQTLAELGVPIATTNYDGLLEEATGLQPVTWRQPGLVEKVLQGDHQAILHLHGHWQDPSSVVLGQRSYDRVLGDAHAQQTLRRILASRTVLFIGCGEGLDDPDFGLLRRWAQETLVASPYHHYRLLLAKAVAKGPGRVPADRIYAVSYGKAHADLGAFLRQLVSTAPPSAPITPPRDAPVAHGSMPPPEASSAGTSPSILATPADPTPSPAEPTSLIALPPVPLPPAPQRWFGRDRLADEFVSVLLQNPPMPLVLCGHPGQGKTTLAKWLLHAPPIIEKYSARRYFLRCEPYRTRADLVVALSSALGLSVAQHAEMMAVTELERGPAVLVLDNLETAWENDRDSLEDLLLRLASLSSSHGLSLIVTLRGAERPAGISWYATPPVPRFDREASQTLFLSIAGSHLRNDSHVNDILNAADDLPLAIELLAHQAEEQPDLEDLWHRWQHERTLILRRGTAITRETNLEISIDLSLKSPRLTEAARQMLGVLAQLPAGIQRTDLRALFGAIGANGLNALHKIGLAQVEGDRWRLLNPVREHVKEHHSVLLSFEAHRALVQYLQKLAKTEGARMFGTDGAQARQRLNHEFPNIVAVLWNQANRQSALNPMQWSGDPKPALGLVRSLGNFLISTELEVDAWVWTLYSVSRSQALATDTGDCALVLGKRALFHIRLEQAESMLLEAQQNFGQARRPLGEAHCVFSLAEVAHRRGDLEMAQRGFEDAKTRYAKVGDPLGEANCISHLAGLAGRCGDLELARRGFEDAKSRHAKVGNPLGVANCISNLAELAQQRGELDLAQRGFEDANSRHAKVGNPLGEASCISHLAGLARQRGDLELAQRGFEDAKSRHAKVGGPLGVANCISNLAELALQRGELELAQRGFEDAKSRFAKVGDPLGVANCISNLAGLARQRGDLELALRCYEDAKSRNAKIGNPLGEAICINNLAELAHQRGELELAQRGIEDAKSRYAKVGSALGEASCILELASLAQERGELELAQRGIEDAKSRFAKVGSALGEASCILELASLAQERGELELAQHGIADAKNRFARLGCPANEARCLSELAEVARKQAKPERAEPLYREAEAYFQKHGYLWELWRCRLSLSGAESDQGGLDSAEAGYLSACAFFASTSVGDKLREAEARIGLATVAKARGQNDRAREYYRQAMDLFARCGLFSKVSDCKRALEALQTPIGT